MRLDKFLSNMGLGSRKDVHKLIASGVVMIDGNTCRARDAQFDENVARVTVNGEFIPYKPFVYIMVNKPAGYLSSTEDGSGPVVTELLSGASMSNRAYFVKPDNPRAIEMLKAIGIMGDNGKVKNDKIRKYNQIDHFIELIDPMLRKLCDAKKKQENGDKTIDIVDCACGKSYLSFALCYYVRFVLKTPCRFTGLDYNSIVIEDSKRIAEKLGYTNMKFIETDIGKYEPDRKYDLLITLHACDIATDLALRFGIDHGVKAMVCVPCCHREMNDQGFELGAADPVLKYGILKARIADSLTDGLRAMYLEAIGYDVSMVEYISPLDTPKNLMMRCELKRGYSQDLMDKYNGLCNSLGVKMSISKESDLIR